jgi:hypothetical protein
MSAKQSLGDILCLLRFLLFFFFFLSFFIYFFLPPKVYPTHFSATTERKSMKLNSNVKHYEQTTFGIFKMAAVAMETAKMLNN